MAGLSAHTLEDNMQSLLIHIMVLKCMSFCATWQSLYYSCNFMTALQNDFLKKEKKYVMVLKGMFLYVI